MKSVFYYITIPHYFCNLMGNTFEILSGIKFYFKCGYFITILKNISGKSKCGYYIFLIKFLLNSKYTHRVNEATTKRCF